MNLQTAFQLMKVEGNVIKLPSQNLPNYAEVKKVMQNNLGKYKGGKTMGFDFTYDPSGLLKALQDGQEVNMKKKFHFFPTPPDAISFVLTMVMPMNGERILEPSAGQGQFIDGIQNFCSVPNQIDCIEINPINRAVLKEKGHNLIHDDFLTFECGEKYNMCIANPPFKDYIEHAYKMAEVAKEVCFIAPSSLEWRNDKKTKALREFILDQNDGQIHKMPKGSFKSSGTMVDCVVAQFYTE